MTSTKSFHACQDICLANMPKASDGHAKCKLHTCQMRRSTSHISIYNMAVCVCTGICMCIYIYMYVYVCSLWVCCC